jgi:hypothetical protein
MKTRLKTAINLGTTVLASLYVFTSLIAPGVFFGKTYRSGSLVVHHDHP